MIDLAFGLQKAMYDRLSAGVTLAPVYQEAAEDTPTPFVIIGEDIVENMGGKNSVLERHTVTIATVCDDQGKAMMRAIQQQNRDALDDQDLTAEGCILSPAIWQSTEDAMLDDGKTYVGQQKFVAWAEPVADDHLS